MAESVSALVTLSMGGAGGRGGALEDLTDASYCRLWLMTLFWLTLLAFRLDEQMVRWGAGGGQATRLTPDTHQSKRLHLMEQVLESQLQSQNNVSVEENNEC